MVDTPITWVIEPDAFSHSDAALVAAVERAGHSVVVWQDAWWERASWPRLEDRVVIFHGSLGNADRIRRELPWSPGSYCDTAAFHCSRWYPEAREWLLHREWRVLPARELVEGSETVLDEIHATESAFFRPDSPLKPFAGRVLTRGGITLARLDHGFYYDDVELPVVVAPTRSVTAEWRFVVAQGVVVAGSRYAADGRTALPGDPTGAPWHFAADVASRLRAPEPVYVLDVCQADERLWLLELNPFSGADLYGCSAGDVVQAVSAASGR